MTDVRARRLSALSTLLREGKAARQDELVAALRSLGHEVTQATVSRDLDRLGAVRLRRGGETRYALGDFGDRPVRQPEDRLRTLLAEWVSAITPAASLVVIRTPPGSAHLIGVALDEAALAEVAGTICGDDTLFVACASAEVAQELTERWQGWLNPGPGQG